ncbi:MAG: sigma-70 family RNA polymerase sigma factor [Proteobacteria bacterium]|nr:sigma-70 family RNA polymerase sigma factor [Pseudomonadota bacterium]
MQALARGLEGTATAVDADREHHFAAFVAEHRDRAVGLAGRLCGGDTAAAEDIAQEAFVRAYRTLGRFRGEARLSTWFYRILVNEARRYTRWRTLRQRFAGELAAEPEDPAARVRPDPALKRRVTKAVNGLSRGQREVFILVHLEGFTVREAAEITGRAVGTVKSHLHRALRALRAELADLAPAPEVETS